MDTWKRRIKGLKLLTFKNFLNPVNSVVGFGIISLFFLQGHFVCENS